MSKILITGASGFVGSFLVEEALKSGLEVYAGIRTTSRRRWLRDKRINLLEQDLSDQTHLEGCMKRYQFDYVIHNAGITKARNITEYNRINADLTKNVAESAQASDSLRKFVFMSSLAAYGPADYQEDKVLSSKSTPHPVTAYGRSKLSAEKIIKEIVGLPYLIFRPTGIFGPRESEFLAIFKTINKGIAPSIGLDEQWLSLIYIKDFARLLVKATVSNVHAKEYFVTDGNLYAASKFNRIIAESLGKNPFNMRIPLSMVYTSAILNDLLAKVTGKTPMLNRDKYAEIKARIFDCDISDLVKDFDFRPQYGLESAVLETAEWYRVNNWL